MMEAPLKHLYGMGATAAGADCRDFREREPARGVPGPLSARVFRRAGAAHRDRARAGGSEARILILDEPVSALDVSVQAQVLNLLADLKREFDLTYLFISHDLAVVEAVSDRIAVLYFGSVVEIGRAEDIFATPRHPYTRLLAQSAPVVGRPLTEPEAKGMELPDPLNPPPGCAFAARCPRAQARCSAETPHLSRQGETSEVACFFPLDE